MSGSETYTIGKVVKRLSSSYPDLTVSKVRFLEAEGLVEPQRTPSGYRLYSEDDVARIETILRLQKNYFYPLSVIKERLEALDAQEGCADERSVGFEPAAESALHGAIPIEDAPSLLGVSVSFVRSLADNGLIKLGTVSFGHQTFDGADARLVLAADELKGFGIDPRFLKPYLQRANRDVPLFRQAISTKMGRQNSLDDPHARRLFDDTLETLIRLTNCIGESIVRREVRAEFNYPDDEL